LAKGDVIAVFPEGTTSDGTELLRFHASLLQPIVDADGHVQPVAIRYRTPAGHHSSAPAYAGETSFL
jgi:1-acyl-sn-glycerol-3-phosphate acyltransferase